MSSKVISLIPHYKLVSVILRGFTLESSINWLYGSFSNKFPHISSPLYNVMYTELLFQYQCYNGFELFFIISQ